MIKCLNCLIVALILVIPIVIPEELMAQTAPQDAGYHPVVDVSQLPELEFSPGPGDDTARLQAMIVEASETRSGPVGRRRSGARIVVAPGSYELRGVELLSDVYIRFRPGVRITLASGTTTGNVFVLGGGISNVSLLTFGSSPTRMFAPATATSIDRPERYRAFSLGDVFNFEIVNFRVRSNLSRFSSISMSPDGGADGGVPTQGTIRRFRSEGNSAGFGAIQIHGCARMRFRDISSIGGVTLRLETGIENTAGITDLDARDIRCRNGRTGVLFSPHAIQSHNRIAISRVRTTNCAFAVEFNDGFVDRNSASMGPEFTSPGRFENVRVSNVQATFGDSPGASAYVRSRLLDLVPERFLPVLPDNALDFAEVANRAGNHFEARPIGVIYNRGGYPVTLSGLRSRGFPSDLEAPLISTLDTPVRNTTSADLISQGSMLLDELEELREMLP